MTCSTSVRASTVAALVTLVLAAQVAHAQSRVRYGRITAVTPTTVDNTAGRNVGRLVGGGIGLASGSGQSSSNRALRTVGGAAVGGRVAAGATRTQAFEYTVLIGGTNTVRIVSDQAGKRVGDCAAAATRRCAGTPSAAAATGRRSGSGACACSRA